MLTNILKNRTFIFTVNLIEAIISLFTIPKIMNLSNYFYQNMNKISYARSTELITDFIISFVCWLPITIIVVWIDIDTLNI